MPHFQSSSFMSSILPPTPTPALLINKVTGPPSNFSACAARLCTCAALLTSQRTAKAAPPFSVIICTVSLALASLMSAQTTAPPRRASSRAKLRPMPLPAPVTTARALRLGLLLAAFKKGIMALILLLVAVTLMDQHSCVGPWILGCFYVAAGVKLAG